MKKLIQRLVVHFTVPLMIVLTAVQPLYCQQGLTLSARLTTQDVNISLSNNSGLDSAVDCCKGNGAAKIYPEANGTLEVTLQRSRLSIAHEALTLPETGGDATFSAQQRYKNGTFANDPRGRGILITPNSIIVQN